MRPVSLLTSFSVDVVRLGSIWKPDGEVLGTVLFHFYHNGPFHHRFNGRLTALVFPLRWG